MEEVCERIKDVLTRWGMDYRKKCVGRTRAGFSKIKYVCVGII